MLHSISNDMSYRGVVSKIMNLVKVVLDKEGMVDRSWIKNHQWAVVPMWKWSNVVGDPEAHFDERDAEWLCNGLQRWSFQYIYAVLLDRDRGIYDILRITADTHTVVEFGRSYGDQIAVLLDEDAKISVLCLKDYNVVAGPAMFVRRVLNTDIADARSFFWAEAGSVSNSQVQERYKRVALMYDSCNGINGVMVKSKGLIDRMRALRDEVVDDVWSLDIKYLESKQWTVVPIDNGTHSSEYGVRWVARAIRKFHVRRLMAISTEEQMDDCYLFPASIKGIESFIHTSYGLNFLLFPSDLSFVILYTSEDHNVVAGPKGFVEIATGNSIEVAWNTFLKYAKDPEWGDEHRSMMLKFAGRYSRFV